MKLKGAAAITAVTGFVFLIVPGSRSFLLKAPQGRGGGGGGGRCRRIGICSSWQRQEALPLRPVAVVVIHSSLNPIVLSATNADNGDDWWDYDASKYEVAGPKSFSSEDSYGRGGRNSGGGYSGEGGGGGDFRGARRKPPRMFMRDSSRDASSVDEAAVKDLLDRRDRAKRARDYDAADAIREELLRTFHVGVNDRERTWRTGVSGSGSGRKFGGGGGRGGRGDRGGGRGRDGGSPRRPRDFGPNGHDYHLADGAGDNVSGLSEWEIHEKIANRLRAKMSRNFRLADDIQAELVERNVFVHDGQKEWRADGVPFDGFSSSTGRSKRSSGRYTKSPYSDPSVEAGISDQLIEGMIRERFRLKEAKQYDKADTIRDGLEARYGVIIDDRTLQWSIGGDFGEENNRQRVMADAFSRRGYVQSTSSLRLSKDEEAFIQGQIEDRLQAKAERDFKLADSIRDDLFERFDVTINDRKKLWSVGGLFEEIEDRSLLPNKKKGTPRGVYTRRGGGQLSNEDVRTIETSLMERYQAKKARDFDTADRIRDDLIATYGIAVDDKLSEWRVVTDEYVQSADSMDDTLSDDDVAYISAQLRERAAHKAERNYEAADAIRDALVQRYEIFIDDRVKEWKIFGGPHGAGEYVGAPTAEDESWESYREDLDKAVAVDGKEDVSDTFFTGDDNVDDNNDDSAGVAILTEESERTSSTDDNYYRADLDADLDSLLSYSSDEDVDDPVKDVGTEYDFDDELDRLLSISDDPPAMEDNDNNNDTNDVHDNDFGSSKGGGPNDLDAYMDSVLSVSDDDLQDLGMEENDIDTTTEVDVDVDVEVESPSALVEEDGLTKLTVVQLKEKLRSVGLPVSGKKADLISRLLTHTNDDDA